MSDSLFQLYEPHTEYARAVTLRGENFDELADELSKLGDGMYLVGKVIRWGEPYALTLTPHERHADKGAETLTCHLHQMIVDRPGKPLEVMDRHEFRHDWRMTAADPFRG